MPQSLVKNYQHLIFSTKHRLPLLADLQFREHMHRYLGGVCSNLDSPPIIVGGHIEHVHVVCRMSKRFSVETFIRELKVESSKWAKTQGDSLRNFRWQSGYGAFSISHSHVEALTSYVQNQEEHHRKESFQDEFRRLLRKYKIDFDERYVWD